MIIHIVGGGPLTELPSLHNWNSPEIIWVGVDRGVYTLMKQSISPKVAFGDFDSVSKEEFEEIKHNVEQVYRYHPEKDETDMELAYTWAIEQSPNKIRIFGATGGRMDHFIANIQLLIRKVTNKISCNVEIVDSKNTLVVFPPGEYTVDIEQEKRYISFFSMSEKVENLSLLGFKYELNRHSLQLGSTLCISNELIQSSGTFSFTSGILLMVRSTD
ncbi:thiamine diphosphokinase [Bacillus spongiae]|uniref:Thiamine diphosphokinase n=1 Tax=Bacillus spongiae TaxID=2683610 RepID=A0ABU8H9Y3_9BACI